VALSATSQNAEGWTLVADAKSRIAIYGSNTVIEKLAILDRFGFVLDNKNSGQAFINLVQAMRADGFGNRVNVSPADLNAILLGVR
jgi:predicted AAA+ superfamily ATPase